MAWNTGKYYNGEPLHPYYTQIAGENASQFGEVLTVTRTPIIELNSSYGTTALRDIKTTANSGTITDSTTGEIKLSTSTTANGEAILKTASRIRYIPGYGAEVGVGVRIPTDAAGNAEFKWGIREDGENEGIYFGQDATGMYVATLRGGTETKTYQSSWNLDPMDGSGDSEIDLDASDGYVYQIRFTWYGYGQIEWGILLIKDNNQHFHVVHQTRIDGTTSIQTPNLPLFVEVNNGGDATNYDLYVGGRQASIIGNYVPKFRITGQPRGSVNTSATLIPLVSFRSKSAFKDRGLKVRGFTLIPSSANLVIEVRLNPTSLTGASWITPTNYTAAETAVEADISATAISGGEVIYSGLAAAGQPNSGQNQTNLIDLDIPEDQTVSLCVRTLTGSGSVVSHFSLTEEW